MTDNGNQPEMVTISRELLQSIVDYLSSCPAAQVYAMLRRLEDEQTAQQLEAEA